MHSLRRQIHLAKLSVAFFVKELFKLALFPVGAKEPSSFEPDGRYRVYGQEDSPADDRVVGPVEAEEFRFAWPISQVDKDENRVHDEIDDQVAVEVL